VWGCDGKRRAGVMPTNLGERERERGAAAVGGDVAGGLSQCLALLAWCSTVVLSVACGGARAEGDGRGGERTRLRG